MKVGPVSNLSLETVTVEATTLPSVVGQRKARRWESDITCDAEE